MCLSDLKHFHFFVSLLLMTNVLNLISCFSHIVFQTVQSCKLQRPEARSTFTFHMCLLPEALSLLHFASVDFIKFLFFLVFKIFVSIVQDVNFFQKNHLSKEARGQRHFHFSHVSLAFRIGWCRWWWDYVISIHAIGYVSYGYACSSVSVSKVVSKMQQRGQRPKALSLFHMCLCQKHFHFFDLLLLISSSLYFFLLQIYIFKSSDSKIKI